MGRPSLIFRRHHETVNIYLKFRKDTGKGVLYYGVDQSNAHWTTQRFNQLALDTREEDVFMGEFLAFSFQLILKHENMIKRLCFKYALLTYSRCSDL